QKEVEEVLIATDKEGILVKADTIGSLEALSNILRQHNIKIRKASVGDITKKDVTEAQSNAQTSPVTAVILGFNIKVPDEVKNAAMNVKIFHSDIIYALIDQFEAWLAAETKRLEAQKIEGLVRPCKMRIIPNYVFRQSHPAIVGMDILVGTIKVGTKVLKDGKEITSIKSIQHEKESVSSVSAGKQVAIALPNVTVGRQIHENDILYSAIPEPDFRKLKDNKQYLSKDEIEVLKEIAQMRRKDNPVWGV
ncbi:MAG: intein-containing translation initiation factor IF-2, partial [Candidatus Aenigmarchaeota archaeon]|nr:intein-containing translation initiation factor IF-2 [Candidatus Aenigmarchaeota archaeon]